MTPAKHIPLHRKATALLADNPKFSIIGAIVVALIIGIKGYASWLGMTPNELMQVPANVRATQAEVRATQEQIERIDRSQKILIAKLVTGGNLTFAQAFELIAEIKDTTGE